MVDLKAKPFNLNDEQLLWVENTIASMTEDEKVGQLFINLTTRRDPATMDRLINRYHIGGVRWGGGTLEEIYDQNMTFLRDSRIPTLIAANCEAGGNGAVREGTLVATGAACGASQTLETVRDMARVGAAEASSVGCNWTFAPICDIISNWRNTIVNTRAFGSDVDGIIARSKAYMEEMHKAGLACAAKHFPGDGSEERDQHLVMGCNDLSVEEWDATFGRVYKELIDAGLDSVMIGHICQPAYSRLLCPGIKDEDIKPATLAPELLGGLLRGKLGFNGLIVTDASHMIGLTAAASRREAVPGVVAAGCDMVLFFGNPEDDLQYMKDAIHSGMITEERLSDALHRILGLKAKLGLNHLALPGKEGLKRVGCAAHHQAAARAADESITLVKDTQHILPIDPSRKKRVLMYYVQSAPANSRAGTDPSKQLMIDELQSAGFEVTAPKDMYEMDMEGNPDMARLMAKPSMKEIREKYDLCLMVIHMRGYAQTNNNRLVYSMGHSQEAPWYVRELPTVCVSLNYTNHLIDVPMMKTFINAYAPTKEYIHALVEKLTGRSPFKGLHDDLVFCGRWEARL